MATRRMIDELVLRGADDWVMAAEVAWLAKSVVGADTPQEISAAAIEVIEAVVIRGLMRLGDVTDGGFFEWDMPGDEAVSRVRREWSALGRLPGLGEICWLANTAEGDSRARLVADR